MNAKQWRAERKAQGLCTDCVSDAAPNRVRCHDCLRKRKAESKKYLEDPENRAKAVEISRSSKVRIRRTLIEKLGGKCVCCGEDTYEFLNFDHKDNDGAEHRRQLGRAGIGNPLYRLMLKDERVLAKFQLMCWNCNCAKGIYGSCPHARN